MKWNTTTRLTEEAQPPHAHTPPQPTTYKHFLLRDKSNSQEVEKWEQRKCQVLRKGNPELCEAKNSTK